MFELVGMYYSPTTPEQGSCCFSCGVKDAFSVGVEFEPVTFGSSEVAGPETQLGFERIAARPLDIAPWATRYALSKST